MGVGEEEEDGESEVKDGEDSGTEVSDEDQFSDGESEEEHEGRIGFHV